MAIWGRLGLALLALAIASIGCRPAPEPERPGSGQVESGGGGNASDGTASLAPEDGRDADLWEDGGGLEAPEPGEEGVGNPFGAGTALPGTSGRSMDPQLMRLTEPGCCAQPTWSADARRILFIDRPPIDGPTGVWAVSLDRPGQDPELVTEDVARYSLGMTFRLERDGDATEVRRMADGRSWRLPAAPTALALAPDGRRAAWTGAAAAVPAERRTGRVWVADLADGLPREVAAVPRGGLVGWLGDDALLLRGRDDLSAEEEVLWSLSLSSGERRELARGHRLRGELPSPDGRWLAYFVTQAPVATANGLWLVELESGRSRRLDDSLFGAYAWRDASRLLIVPLDASADGHRLLELEPMTLATRDLVDPAVTSFTIANGDWAVAPDGQHVAFVEQRDKAIWVLALP